MREHVRLTHYSASCKLANLFLAPEICEFCGMAYKRGSEKFKRHVKNSHKLTSGMSTYSCPCCWSRFGEMLKFRKHVMEEHEQMEFECVPPAEDANDDLNSDQSSDDDDYGGPSGGPAKKPKLIANEEEMRGDKFVKILRRGNYSCDLCPDLKRTMSLANFYSHLIFHARRPFKCSVCNVHWSGCKELEKSPFAKELPSNGHLCSESTLVRIPVKTGKIWRCEWCSDKFEMERERDLHESKEHLDLKSKLEMKNKCLSCNSAYRSYKEWLLHRALEHPKVAGISCLYCDYKAVIATKDGMGK